MHEQPIEYQIQPVLGSTKEIALNLTNKDGNKVDNGHQLLISSINNIILILINLKIFFTLLKIEVPPCIFC